MQSTVEAIAKHTVKLTIEVPEEEFSEDLERAYRSIAKQVRIPGFRKGKVPRKIIDAQIGREAVMEEFLSDAVPGYYNSAVREHDLGPITDPDISLDQVEEGKPLIFTASVEVRPRLELEDYKGVEVERPSTEVTDDDVGDLLERLRERFAELESVGRPAAEGDYVVADIRAAINDEEIPEATRPDYLYAIGSGEFGDALDKELAGSKAGDILRFNDTLGPRFGERAGTEVTFSVLVKEVKGRRLPDLDDGLAKTASEFDTLEELKDSLRETVRASKERQADGAVRDRVLQTLIERIDVELPETLIDEETEHRVTSARERAERVGMSLDDLLETQGWDEARLRADAREHAVRAITADLILESVARSEGLEVTAEELGAEISRLAAQVDRDPEEVAKTLERSGQMITLAGDIIRSKALDLLVEHADVESDAQDATEARETQGTEGAESQDLQSGHDVAEEEHQDPEREPAEETS